MLCSNQSGHKLRKPSKQHSCKGFIHQPYIGSKCHQHSLMVMTLIPKLHSNLALTSPADECFNLYMYSQWPCRVCFVFIMSYSQLFRSIKGMFIQCTNVKPMCSIDYITCTITIQSQQYIIILLHVKHKLWVPLIHSCMIKQSSCNTSIWFVSAGKCYHIWYKAPLLINIMQLCCKSLTGFNQRKDLRVLIPTSEETVPFSSRRMWRKIHLD